MTAKGSPTHVVVISHRVHRRLKAFCAKRGLKLGAVANSFLLKQLSDTPK